MRTLLLADDNVTVQRVIALTFAQEPVRIVTASDGHQAMDRVMVERPDIVLAGTTLPQVSGYELARFVKSKTHDIPVLLLSGAFETIDQARLESSGANGVIEKPLDPTAVIRRVKELLGIKTDTAPAAPAGRLVTPGGAPAERKPPAAPRTASSSRPMRPATRPEPSPAAAAKDTADVNALDSAFDSLDQQLAGKTPSTPQRNPARPIGRTVSGDPRSPGKRPPADAGERGNPVYEVDDDWFGEASANASADAGSGDKEHRELLEDLRAPELQRAAPAEGTPPPHPVFEVDDEWFADGERTREARELEQRQLAAEMGIHEVELPEPNRPAPAIVSDDFAYSEEDFAAGRTTPEPLPDAREVFEVQVRALHKVSEVHVQEVREPDSSTEAPAIAPLSGPAFATPPEPPARVADDFAALLAFEQGEKKAPPIIEPVIHAVAPEITPEMIEQIAASVASRLEASIRDTVRTVVSDTSERLVREEI